LFAWDAAADVQGLAARPASGVIGLPPIATYNCGSASAERLGRDLDHLAELFSVICLQEASDRRRVIKAFRRRHPGWRAFRARLRPGGPAVPILYDARQLDRRRRRSVKAVGRRWVGPEGAGPTYAKTKRINELTLRDRHTGLVFTVGNTHFIPSATRGDLEHREKAARIQHYSDHLDAVIRRPAKVSGPYVLAGDFNATPDFPPLHRLSRADWHGWTSFGTHGHRAIDHVLAHGRRLHAVGAAELLDHLSSDHSAVGRIYEYEYRGGAASA